MKISPWQLGNTTVRNPLRFQGGLAAYALSNVEGKIRGSEEKERGFINVLEKAQVITLNEEREDSTYSVGRKWRAALGSLGFIFPEIPETSSISQSEIGQLDCISSNGKRLIEADTVFAIQDCFLRALVAYTIPNPIETRFQHYAKFSPLVHVIKFLSHLEKMGEQAYLTFNEVACYVQMSGGADDITEILSTMLKERKTRDSAANKKQFDKSVRERAAKKATCNADSLKDYADMNIRYLKASGLFQAKGRGIALLSERTVLAHKILRTWHPAKTDKEYFENLCVGARLPTDSKETARDLVDDLVTQLNNRGINIDISKRPQKSVREIEALRYSLEEELFAQKEAEFALRQRAQWKEISKYMELLIDRNNRGVELDNGEEIKVPRDEAPAYFEWVIWRAMLAINDLKCKPQDSRGFKIDQDFLPINTATGGRPDLLFEFEEFILVIEVTFTTNSRQEAAEGEPVRRHVADVLETYQKNKPVYGLFIANAIDSNTAETFRIGSWYNKEDLRLNLNITPMPLAAFKTYFDALMSSKNIHNMKIKSLLDLCNEPRSNLHGPEWKNKIVELVVAESMTLA